MATKIKKTSVANRVPNTFVLSTDGDIGVNTHDGRLWVSNGSVVSEIGGGSGISGGSNTQVQFNDSGNFGGNANLTYNKTTSTLTVNGTISSTNLVSSGNVTIGGNVSIANEITNVRGIRFDRDNPVVDPLIPTPQEGLMTWNPIEQCLDIHQNDTTLQVGLEHMTLFKNTTGATIVDGTVLEVIGANGDGNPTVALFTANSAADSLHVIGVCTESVANGALGRATKFGKIRGLNTTGSPYSETWSVGTELFVSPTVAGGLTSIKPSPPNQAIFIGTVTKLGATDGIILINTPTITKLRYGVFSDTTTQSAVAANTAYPIKFNATDFAAGHSVASRYSGSNNAIVAAVSGLYNYQFSLQFSSTTNQTRDIWIWPRKNNSDIPNSATRISITDQTTYVVAAWNFVVSMQANDDFQLMWAASAGSNVISITAFSATAFCPAIPSCILTVTQASI